MSGLAVLILLAGALAIAAELLGDNDKDPD